MCIIKAGASVLVWGGGGGGDGVGRKMMDRRIYGRVGSEGGKILQDEWGGGIFSYFSLLPSFFFVGALEATAETEVVCSCLGPARVKKAEWAPSHVLGAGPISDIK